LANSRPPSWLAPAACIDAPCGCIRRPIRAPFFPAAFRVPPVGAVAWPTHSRQPPAAGESPLSPEPAPPPREYGETVAQPPLPDATTPAARWPRLTGKIPDDWQR